MKIQIRSDLSHRTIVERMDLQRRMKRCQKKLVQIMPCLQNLIPAPMTKQKIMDFIKCINAPMLAKLDRMAMRQKPALLCWISENWENIENALQAQPAKPKETIILPQIDMDSIFRSIEYEPSLSLDFPLQDDFAML